MFVFVDLLTFKAFKLTQLALLIDLFYFNFIILSAVFLNILVVTNVSFKIFLFV